MNSLYNSIVASSSWRTYWSSTNIAPLWPTWETVLRPTIVNSTWKQKTVLELVDHVFIDWWCTYPWSKSICMMAIYRNIASFSPLEGNLHGNKVSSTKVGWWCVTGRVQWLWSQPATRALLLLLLVLLVMERMQEGMLQKAACNCLEREDCFLAVWFRTWNLQVYCLNE
jgi:hypothetical protein